MNEGKICGTDSKKIFDELIVMFPGLIKEGVKYSPQKHSGFVRCFLKNGISLWFVIYSNIAKDRQDKDGKWKNTFSPDRRIITEEYMKPEAEKDYKIDFETDFRLVFARDKNVGKNEYVFMGVYEKHIPEKQLGHKTLEYRLVSDVFDGELLK